MVLNGNHRLDGDFIAEPGTVSDSPPKVFNDSQQV